MPFSKYSLPYSQCASVSPLRRLPKAAIAALQILQPARRAAARCGAWMMLGLSLLPGNDAADQSWSSRQELRNTRSPALSSMTAISIVLLPCDKLRTPKNKKTQSCLAHVASTFQHACSTACVVAGVGSFVFLLHCLCSRGLLVTLSAMRWGWLLRH